jgi:enamine deaminase RidA (YjgF/YER057c/UK114 family)
MIRFTNPSGMPDPISMYSNVAVADVPGGARMISVAGQVGYLPDGTLAGPGVAEQGPQIMANLAAALASEGATLSDVIKFTTYLVSADDIEAFFEMRAATFPALFHGAYPPNTLLVVDRLVRPELVLEIEALAVTGA